MRNQFSIRLMRGSCAAYGLRIAYRFASYEGWNGLKFAYREGGTGAGVEELKELEEVLKAEEPRAKRGSFVMNRNVILDSRTCKVDYFVKIEDPGFFPSSA